MSESEDDGSAVESSPFHKPSFVLIVVDTHPAMFVKGAEETSPFQDSITACYQLANSVIFTQNKRSWSPFGVALACDEASASLIDFNDNLLNSIKLLKEKSTLSNEELADLYQRKAPLDLGSFFLFCKKKLKNISSVFYKRTIIYITNDDNPTRSDPNLRFTALNEAGNFEGAEIDFQLVTTNGNFDYTIFYNELFSLLKTDLVENLVLDREGLLEKLSSTVLVRLTQRKLRFFPFLGDDKRFLQVVEKKYIREPKLYNNGHVSTEGRSIKKQAPALQAEKEYELPCERETLQFDAEERVKIIDSPLPVGFTLVRVVQRVTPVGLLITSPSILEVSPGEELDFLDAFWQYCVDHDTVLVCARKLRHLGKINYVEMIPKFVNKARVFMVKQIPFATDFNHWDNETKGEPDVNYAEDKVAIIDELIDRMTFDYNLYMFSDISHTKKANFLRAKLLDEPYVEEVDGEWLDYNEIDKRVGDLAERFEQAFGEDEEEEPVGAQKRKAPPKSNQAKKAK